MMFDLGYGVPPGLLPFAYAALDASALLVLSTAPSRYVIRTTTTPVTSR